MEVDLNSSIDSLDTCADEFHNQSIVLEIEFYVVLLRWHASHHFTFYVAPFSSQTCILPN